MIPTAFRPIGRGGAPVTSKSYVQSGLILHLDGIDNAGFEQHASTLTQWVDLSGQGNHAIVNSGSAAFNPDSWQGDGYAYFNLLSTFFNAQQSARKFTIETVFKLQTNGRENEFIIGFGNSSAQRICWIYGSEATSPTSSNGVYAVNVNSAVYTDQYHTGSTQKTLNAVSLAVTLDANICSVYRSGALAIRKASTANYAASAYKRIGSCAFMSNMTFRGKLYAIRVYSRPLSDVEILQNYQIDQKRFNIT